MGNKQYVRWLKGIFVLCVCIEVIVVPVGQVNAQTYLQTNSTLQEKEGEIQIIRPATGELEQLEAIYISDEEVEERSLASSSQNANVRNNTNVMQFLQYGSNYGYQDMSKRSNGEGRQRLYRNLEEICEAFTLSCEDAGTEYVSSKEYFVAGIANLYDYSLSAEEKIETYFMFRHDNPQYFWLSNQVLYSDSRLLILTYDNYKLGTERQETLEEIVETVSEVYQSQITISDSAYEKVLKIHDILIADIEYASDVSKPITHSIAGAMTSEKEAVCEGYTKVMQVMMNSYGITNIYVTGEGNGEGHAWNMVYMKDGKFYWLDATWDDQPYEIYQHDYFLVGNENFTDHFPDMSSGTGTNFLYDLPEASDKDYVNMPYEDGISRGDINEDNVINLSDLMLCLNHVSKKADLDGGGLTAADVNDDGNVDLTDLMKLLNYMGKKTTVL